MIVIVCTFCNIFLQGLIIASEFSLSNYIEEQMKVIVCTFINCILKVLIIASGIIVQLYRRANESNCITILSTICRKC